MTRERYSRRDFLKTCSVGLAGATFLGVAGCGADSGSDNQGGQDTYKLRLSAWGAMDHPQVTEFVPKFTELVEEKSQNQIKVEFFPGGELVDQDAVATAIPNGTADISLTGVAQWTGVDKDFGIVASPLFSLQLEEFWPVMKPGTPLFKEFDSMYQEQNTKLLTAINIGPLVFTSKGPLKSPEDFRGKTIRGSSNPDTELIEALGAAPTILDISDVYSGLQRGVVDASYGGLDGAFGMKVYEVTDHLILPQGLFGTAVNGYVMNQDALESLPPDLQKVVLEAAEEAGEDANQTFITSYDETVQEFRDKEMNVTELSPDDSEFKEALAPLLEEHKAKYPPDLVKPLNEDKEDVK